MSDKYQCCYIYPGLLNAGCRRTQDLFKLVSGKRPDDYTLACYQHVGRMLSEVEVTTVFPVSLEDLEV